MAASGAASSWPAPPAFSQRTPPAPVEGEYSMFGVTRTTAPAEAPPLDEQVYSDTAERCAELRKLNRSLLEGFLQLLQLMADSPAQCCDKVADLRTLFLNFQHLLNTFRPHEAREELIATVRQQVAAKQALIDELDAACTSALEEARAAASLTEDPEGEDEPMEVTVPEPRPPVTLTFPIAPVRPESPKNDPQTLERMLEELAAVEKY